MLDANDAEREPTGCERETVFRALSRLPGNFAKFMSQRFSLLTGRFAICRLSPQAGLPPEPAGATFWSVTRTPEEVSIVCDEHLAPRCDSVERVWRGLKIQGPIDFDLPGVLKSLVSPLADLELGVFVVSTYDTDYVFIKEIDIEKAIRALVAAGHVEIG